MHDLGAKLCSEPAFKKRYYSLLMRSLIETLGRGVTPEKKWLNRPIDWNYLIYCASILAQSESGEARDYALRIAQFCLRSAEASAHQKVAATIVLDTVANKLAIKLAVEKEYIEKSVADGSMLPISLRFDWTRRKLQNTIYPSHSESFFANPFQKRLWHSISEHRFVSASAPTAAGKSFAIERWVLDCAKEHDAPVAYIVPTRALLNEVELDIRKNFEGVRVTSHPDLADGQKIEIFVLTQERLLVLLNRRPSLQFSALIIDEAQKLGDRHRGILLQEAIDRVRLCSPFVKICYISPLTSNPEILLEEFLPDEALSFSSNATTVAQNLFWVSQVRRKPCEFDVEYCHPRRTDLVGKIELPTRPSGSRERIAFIARAIGRSFPGNVIYANDANEAETISEILYNDDSLPLIDDPEVAHLIDLCKRSVHSKFLLAKVLEKGIAFHYGNIPQALRLAVEALFKENKIRYLICTSTLVEGVNTSCRNIFIRGPRKGPGNPMSSSDFWNLAGRAGRWGTEFNGNIFCIDPRNQYAWPTGAPAQRKPFKIERALDKLVASNSGFFEYLASGAPNVREPLKQYEYALWQLACTTYRNGTLDQSPLSKRISPSRLRQAEKYVRSIIAGVTVPLELIQRHPGISPLAASRMKKYFADNASKLTSLALADPAEEDPVRNYATAFEACYRHLNANPLGEGRRAMALAILVTHWARGYRIPYIVQRRIRYYGEKGIPYDINVVIRRILEDIETVARFEAPRYLGCYADIYRLVANEVGIAVEADFADRLSDYLEFGVSTKSQLALMRLGFSRTAAIELRRSLPNEQMTEPEVRAWLAGIDMDQLKAPELIKREISTLLELLVIKRRDQN